MELNKETYEIWMVDYLDGNLSDQQIAELRSFLILHPELDCDLEEEMISLETSSLMFDNKQDLNKTIPYSKFEDLSVSSIEGLLNSKEDQNFKSEISKDDVLDKHFKLFELSKLESEFIEFPNKANLKKTKVIALSFKKVIQYGVAAACLVGAFVWFNIPANVSTSYVADSELYQYQEVNDKAPLIEFNRDNRHNNIAIVQAKETQIVHKKPERLIENNQKSKQRESIFIPSNKHEYTLVSNLTYPELETIEISETVDTPSNNIESKIKETLDREMPEDWQKYTLIDKVAFAINRIGKETDTNIQLKTAKNEQGQIVNWALNLGKIRISQ